MIAFKSSAGTGVSQEAESSSDKLCLLVSRRCNLRCSFCRVRFTEMDMDWPTAKSGVDHYLASLAPGARPRIKFFGGEPLLNVPLIRQVVDEGRDSWRARGLRFEISTNGTLLNDELISYFKSRAEVCVTVSQWEPRASALPGVWFTLVLEPGVQALGLLRDLRRLLKAGFRGFNFLPAYYEEWAPEELNSLRRSLTAASVLIAGLWRKAVPIRVKNLELWSPVPLYNDAITLDVDGTFYASNLVQCEGTEKFHSELKLGRVEEPLGFLKNARRPSGERLAKILEKWSGPSLWEHTRAVDEALGEFVSSLRSAKEGME